jgi:uroporphyrinogen III methyltransferase/synthase
VTFLGAGPGEPGLLTVRGRDALEEADVVVADADVPPALVEQARAGVERILVPPERPGSLEPVHVLLAAQVARGRRVVRVAAGDGASLHGELAALAATGVPVDVIPGLPRAQAGAWLAGIPCDAAAAWLAPRGLEVGRPHPLAATGLVLVTGGEDQLATAVAALLRGGWMPSAPAAIIGDPGASRQRVCVGALRGVIAEARAAGVGFPALLAAGEAVGRRVAWLERRPLHGRRVLVTRPRSQAGRLATLLEAYGAEVVAVPAIRLEPPEDWGPLDAAIADLDRFRWIAFTSVNGVSAFRDRLLQARRDMRHLARVRVAAIGPETAEALRRTGIEPDLVPSEYRAEGLVEALKTRVARGDTLLLVRAAEARDVVPRELAARGVHVAVVPAYRTVLAKEGAERVIALLATGALDVVTFTSSSTVRGFVGLVAPHDPRQLLRTVTVAAIGPITSGTLEEHGLRAHVVPRDYTVPALADAIAGHFAGAPPAAGRG